LQVGFNLGFVFDYYQVHNAGDAVFLQLPTPVSAMYFFGEKIGSGLFLRADLGPTFFFYSYSTTGSYTVTRSHDPALVDTGFKMGYGGSASLGYAIPFSPTASFLISGSAASRASNLASHFQSNSNDLLKTTTFSISGGVLF